MIFIDSSAEDLQSQALPYEQLRTSSRSMPPVSHEATELKKEVLLLAQEPNSFVALAARLRELHDLDGTAFKTALKGKFLQPRRAYELVRIAKKFIDAGVPAERLEAIGWTKLGVLMRHFDKPGVKPMPLEAQLDRAERATVHMLAAQLKSQSDAPNTRVVLLRLTPDQYEAYRACMITNGAEKATKGKGLVGQEEALMNLIKKVKQSQKTP